MKPVRSEIRVLAVATYPKLAAATRYRVLQFVDELAALGISVDVRPLLSNETFSILYDRSRSGRVAAGVAAGLVRRLRDAFAVHDYDVVFIQREAAILGPPWFEWLAHQRKPIVLDLDDSTYIRRKSGTRGAIAEWLKCHGKTDQLIGWADRVIAGSPAVAEYASSRGVQSVVMPTIVDVRVFQPAKCLPSREPLVIGWIGTHSTYPYIKALLPMFARLRDRYNFRLRIVGSGEGSHPEWPFVEYVSWQLETEVTELQSFDLAVYPIERDEWGEGKSGLKSIQYLSCGVPFVVSPVGVARQIGIEGETHLCAESEDEWETALFRLLVEPNLRATMGVAGRTYAVANYSISDYARRIAKIVVDCANRGE